MMKPRILYHVDGYYVLQLKNCEDQDLVLHFGPYSYHNKPFILRNWSIDYEFAPDYLLSIPLWVKFPRLPLGYWSANLLIKLASIVGKLIYTDKTTADIERIFFARVLVETDISHPLNDSIEINTPTKVFHQIIAYNWRPKYYTNCMRFGHAFS